MPNLGLQDVIVLLGAFFFTALPIVVTAAVVWHIAKRRSRPETIATYQCRHCRQRVPDLGSFCPACGKPRTDLRTEQ